MFLSTACPYTKWEIEGWRFKDVKPGQIDREKAHAENDDCIACARYIALRSPQAADLPAGPVDPHQRIVDIVREVVAEQERRRGGPGEWIGAERLQYT